MNENENKTMSDIDKMKEYREYQIKIMKECIVDAMKVSTLSNARDIAIAFFNLRASPFFYFSSHVAESGFSESEEVPKAQEILKAQDAPKIKEEKKEDNITEKMKEIGWFESKSKPNLFIYSEKGADGETIYFCDLRKGLLNDKSFWATTTKDGNTVYISREKVKEHHAVKAAKKMLEPLKIIKKEEITEAKI